jgi:toxin CptA
VWLPGESGAYAAAIAGGLLLGVGALINGGCYLGSVLYLGSGNLNFLLTLVGIVTGNAACRYATGSALPAGPVLRMSMGQAWLAGGGGFLLIILLALSRARSRERIVAVIAGLLAGLVYARHPGWSYGAVLDAIAPGRHAVLNWVAILSALLLLAGALSGALLAGRFQLQWPATGRSLRCLAGGTIMGVGAAQAHGGNDLLLLWAIPGLTLYGTLAYASMLLAIGAGLLPGLWRRDFSSTKP